VAGDVTRPRIRTDRPGLTEAALTDAYAEAAEAAHDDGTVTEVAMFEGVQALIVPPSHDLDAAAEAAREDGDITGLVLPGGVLALVMPAPEGGSIYPPGGPAYPAGRRAVEVDGFLDAAYARQSGPPFTGHPVPEPDEVPVTLGVQRYDNALAGEPYYEAPVTIDVLEWNIRIQLTDAAAAQLAAALQAVLPRRLSETPAGKEPAS
jgi:hypothetical protein